MRARDPPDQRTTIPLEVSSTPTITPSHYRLIGLTTATASVETRISYLCSMVPLFAKYFMDNRSIQTSACWMFGGIAWGQHTLQWLRSYICSFILFSPNYRFKGHIVHKIYLHISHGVISIKYDDMKSVMSSRGDRTGSTPCGFFCKNFHFAPLFVEHSLR